MLETRVRDSGYVVRAVGWYFGGVSGRLTAGDAGEQGNAGKQPGMGVCTLMKSPDGLYLPQYGSTQGSDPVCWRVHMRPASDMNWSSGDSRWPLRFRFH